MMYRPSIISMKLVRFSDDYGGSPLFEVFYDDGTIAYFEPDNFHIYQDGRYYEVDK